MTVTLAHLAAALLLCAPPPAAQEIPEISIGEPILPDKGATEARPGTQAPKPPPQTPKPADPLSYTESGCFTVTLPKGWDRKSSPFGLAAKGRKLRGLEVAGPKGSEGVASRISVFYYPPDNALQKTPEDFIKAHSAAPAGAAAGSGEYGKVREEEAGGLPAKLFDRITFEVVASAGKKKKVPVYEYFAVVPAGTGYFVLKYYAPKNIARTHVPAYEGVLDSFVPLVK